jgi:3-keto-5-aminohexanoate cleavage enzyme
LLLDCPFAANAVYGGGHLRVGIEDTGGRTPMTNLETVAAAVELAREVGRPVVQGAAASAALAGIST